MKVTSAAPTAQRQLGRSCGNRWACGPQISSMALIRMNATPIVVIIGAVPATCRNERRQIRSMSTPRTPVVAMVATKSTTSVPTSASPVRDFETAVTPMRFNTTSPTKVPVMKTLKWEKLISSMMPYTMVKPRASRAYIMPSASPLTICWRRTSTVLMTASSAEPFSGPAREAPAREAGSPPTFPAPRRRT